jgi:hypothetical protein
METPQTTLADQSLASARRLIVLVPDRRVDEVALGRSIWEMARPQRLNVLYLCVVRHWGDELQAIHKTTQLNAITNHPAIRVDTMVKAEVGWVKAVKDIQQPGDLIVCDASQKVPERIFWRKPLSQAIADHLHIPVVPITLIHPNGH